MTSNTAHMLLIQLSRSRTCWTTCNACDKIMTVSHSVNNNHIKKRMDFPPKFSVLEVPDFKNSFKLAIKVDSTFNTLFMVSKGEHLSWFILFLTISFLLQVIHIKRPNKLTHSLIGSFNISLVGTPLKCLLTHVIGA